MLVVVPLDFELLSRFCCYLSDISQVVVFISVIHLFGVVIASQVVFYLW